MREAFIAAVVVAAMVWTHTEEAELWAKSKIGQRSLVLSTNTGMSETDCHLNMKKTLSN